MTRESRAAFGLALPGCVARSASGCGLTQQRRDPFAGSDVGMSSVVFPIHRMERSATVMIIGIDPHKSSHTATAVSPATNTAVGSLRIDATLAGYRALERWAGSFPERRWAIKNARGLGRHLAQWLIARGETVLEVRTTSTARVGELSRDGRRKNDVIDASAAASVAALHGELWWWGPRMRRRCARCSTSKPLRVNGSRPSTSCTRCCVISFPAELGPP